jgi:hypothetical protein
MPRITEPFIRPNYRGLNDAEDKLLRSYLRDQDDEVRGLETQVRVGPGEVLPESRPDKFREAWRESSKFRIDALIEYGGRFEVVELKDFIRSSHLGQVLSYRYWLSTERSLDKPLQVVATAPDMNPGAVQPAQFHGVELVPQSLDGERHKQQGLSAQPPFDDL